METNDFTETDVRFECLKLALDGVTCEDDVEVLRVARRFTKFVLGKNKIETSKN